MKLISFPELRQTYEYDCGAKALQALFIFYGQDLNEEDIMKKAQTSRKGTSLAGLKRAAKYFGFKAKIGKMNLKALKKQIDNEKPVILLIQAWSGEKRHNYENDWSNGHYVVAIGYDKNKIYFEDPYRAKRTFLTYKELKKRWHDLDQDKKRQCNKTFIILNKTGQYNYKKAVHMD